MLMMHLIVMQCPENTAWEVLTRASRQNALFAGRFGAGRCKIAMCRGNAVPLQDFAQPLSKYLSKSFRVLTVLHLLT